MQISSNSALQAIRIDLPVARINTAFVPSGQTKNHLKGEKRNQ